MKKITRTKLPSFHFIFFLASLSLASPLLDNVEMYTLKV